MVQEKVLEFRLRGVRDCGGPMDVLGDLSLHVEGLRVSMMRHRRRCAILLLTSLEKRSLERSIFAYDFSLVQKFIHQRQRRHKLTVFFSRHPPLR